MKINTPKSRYHLKIKKKDLVLDVGCGDFPHPRANVCVDKYTDSNYHRLSNLRVLDGQKFINSDGESLPFDDKSFDYVICCHVMEHVPDPAKFMNELIRVGKRGYIEVPSLTGEFLAPMESHKWVCLDINDKIVVVSKKEIGLDKPNLDFSNLFLYHLTSSSLAYKLFIKTHPNILTVRYEWEQSIDFEINPKDIEIKKYFFQPWGKKELEQIFPKKKILTDFWNNILTFGEIIRTYFKS
ncbi:MAG: class I SAM-dependent methyltransferase [Bacteroidales bacterium]|nr:class I SAM-dependent methyltransferase [Bacteroidales bacterium]